MHCLSSSSWTPVMTRDMFDSKFYGTPSVATSPPLFCHTLSFALCDLKKFPETSEQIHKWTLDAARDRGRKIGRQQEMNGWIDGESEGRWRLREEREKC